MWRRESPSSKKIGCMIDLQFNPNDNGEYVLISLEIADLYFAARYAIHIDTIANDYELKPEAGVFRGNSVCR